MPSPETTGYRAGETASAPILDLLRLLLRGLSETEMEAAEKAMRHRIDQTGRLILADFAERLLEQAKTLERRKGLDALHGEAIRAAVRQALKDLQTDPTGGDEG